MPIMHHYACDTVLPRIRWKGKTPRNIRVYMLLGGGRIRDMRHLPLKHVELIRINDPLLAAMELNFT